MKKRRITLISFVLLLALMLGAVSVSAADKVLLYEEQVRKLFFEKYPYITEDNWNGYTEYYSVTSESTTPDYVLVRAYATMGEKNSVEVIGDYVAVSNYTCFPYELGDFVYVPSEDVLYTLAEAYNAGIKAIDKFYSVGWPGIELIGDADEDRKITVKDATWIQKVVAGYEMYAEYDGDIYDYLVRYVHDFNRDNAINVQDATAIQKYLAGITGNYSGEVNEPASNPFLSYIPEDADYEDDCIIVSTKYGWGHDYTLEDFPEYEFSSIEKIGGTDGKGYAIYVLYLKTPGRENVVEAVRALEHRAETDLEAAEPNYIYYVEEWI